MRLTIIGFIALAILSGLSPVTDKPSIARSMPQPIEWRDLVDFMNIHAWKMRLASDAPFNTLTISLSWYERQDNGRFARQRLGEAFETASLQKMTEQVVAVLWRIEGTIARFQVSCPGQSQSDFSVPAQRLANYLAIGDGKMPESMMVDGVHVLAVKWKKDTPTYAPEKQYIDGYIAVECELGVLKGLND